MAPLRTLLHWYPCLLLLSPNILNSSTAFSQTNTPHSTHPHIPTRLDATRTPTPPSTPTPTTSSISHTRRAVLSSLVSAATATTVLTSSNSASAAEEESFADIAERAARLANQSKGIGERVDRSAELERMAKQADKRSAYDFELPVAGKIVNFGDLVKQEFSTDEAGNRSGEKCKAILVVNMKQDDPVARKNIPELISMATKFGKDGEFYVMCSPTDQGYFEPDTSELLRLKLNAEYGYGLNPACILTEKVNLLGTGAHPFWRWIEGTCRSPSGIGRIQGNFEKFLVDGRTGRPLRRYPRQYQPFDIVDDIDAVIKGKTLPPAGANWKEQWREADKEAVSDQFRFQKGLNVFDE